MKTREMKKRVAHVSAAQFEQALQHYADAEGREKEIGKQIEAEVNEVLERYEDELMCLKQGRQTAFDIAQAYCIKNKAILFAKSRSTGIPQVTAGFRLGTPRLKLRKNVSWEQVLNNMEDTLPNYIRTHREPARDLLLASRYSEDVAPLLAKIGVEVVQDELFYIQTKQAA